MVFNVLQNARRYDWFPIGDMKDFFHRVVMPEEDCDALRFYRCIPGQEDQLQGGLELGIIGEERVTLTSFKSSNEDIPYVLFKLIYQALRISASDLNKQNFVFN